MRATALLVPFLAASIARAGGDAASGYDDRVMIDRVAKTLGSIHGRWQNPDQATADQRKTLAFHLSELRAIHRAVGVVLRSREAPREIVAHRRAIQSRLEKFLTRVSVYGRTCELHASARRKLHSLKRAEPATPS